jgi:serine/threonine protein kinase
LKELFEDIFDSKENERLIEDDDIESFFSKYKHVLRLEMEYYPYTLMDVLNHLKSEFEPLKENFIPTIWFYIATQLFFEIIECLDYLHKNKIIHRDLKPTNILISNNFTNRYVKLTDIGILKAFPWKVTMSNSLKMDTAKYIDPVSLKDEYFGEEINIFSLGKIMLEFFNLKDDK